MKKHILLLPIFSLTACFSNPSGLTANFFKNRKWTCWESDDGNIKVYITGRYFGEYTSGVGTIKGGLNKFYYSSFVFNADGDPTSDYLKFYKFDGTYRSDYNYFIKVVTEAYKYAVSNIPINENGFRDILLERKNEINETFSNFIKNCYLLMDTKYVLR